MANARTLRKRIALVAAAAVGVGMLVATPASAASTNLTSGNTIVSAYTADGLTAGDNGTNKQSASLGTAGAFGFATANGVAGPANTVTLQVAPKAGDAVSGTTTTTATTKKAIVTLSGAGSTMTSDTGTVNTAGTTLTLPAGNTLATVTVTTPNAGTITANVYQETAAGSGIFSATAVETVTITVNAAISSNVYSQAKSTVYGFSGDTTTAGAATSTTDAAFSVSALSTAATTPVATFEVTQKDTNGVALTSGFKFVSVTASIGAVQSAHTVNAGSYVSVNAAAVQQFWIAPDGRTGTASITVAINGVTIKTYSITFYSTTVASLAATVIKSNINAAAVTGFTPPTHVLSVVAKDSSGNAIPSLTNLTATSSDTTIATVGTPTWNSTDSVYYVTVTGAASGTATVTIKDSSATVSTTAVLKVSKAVASTVTLSLDKATYAPGDKATITLTAKDANGSPVADGTYAAFLTGALTASASITSTLLAADVTFTNGVATATFFAPLVGGPFSINGTTGTAATLATAVQSAALSVASSVTVTPDAAIAAAKASADAAVAAANAATAAVATLSTTVASLIASITAQLKALSVLVKKIMTKFKIK